MDVQPNRMVYLGYGKYWRADAIVGLKPIEKDRGPGRRTEVFVSSLAEPIVASRSEAAILQEMTAVSEDLFWMRQARDAVGDLVDALEEIPDVLKRMLNSEAHLDVDWWLTRLRATMTAAPPETPSGQKELFD